MKKINERLSGDLKHSAFQKAAEYTRQPGNPEDTNPLLYTKRKIQADTFSMHVNPQIKAEANVIAKMFGADYQVYVFKSVGGTNDEPYVTLDFGKNIANVTNSELHVIVQKNTHSLKNKNSFPVPENIQRRLANFIKKIQNVELPNENLNESHQDGMGSDGDFDFNQEQKRKAVSLYDQGLDLHKQGRTKEAELLYRQALKTGEWLGWTEVELSPYSSLQNENIINEVSRMKVLAGILNEIKANELYFDTFSAAVQYARLEAEKKGYVIDENDWFNRVSTGPGKPSVGETTRFSVALTKNGIPQNKQLSVQVYGMRSGRYELNFYIS